MTVRSIAMVVVVVLSAIALVVLVGWLRSPSARLPPIGEATAVSPLPEATRPSDTGTTKDPGRAGGVRGKGVIVIQGIFDPTGERLLELKPIRRYAYSSGPLPQQAKGRFLATVTYKSGEVTTVPFDALVSDDSAPGVTRHGFFEVTVPVRGEIAFVRITDASGRKVFAHVDGSQIPP